MPLSAVDFVFATRELERRFAGFIAEDPGKERGGILFYTFDQIVKMHWRMHQRIFGTRIAGVITDWIVVPNTSNLPDREYSVSDLKQFIAIGEQTAKARRCFFMDFHTHPSGNAHLPSEDDITFWWEHFNPYGHWAEGAIAAHDRWNHQHFDLYAHHIEQWRGKPRTHTMGRFFRRSYVNYLLRTDERYQQVMSRGS